MQLSDGGEAASRYEVVAPGYTTTPGFTHTVPTLTFSPVPVIG